MRLMTVRGQYCSSAASTSMQRLSFSYESSAAAGDPRKDRALVCYVEDM